jgi:GWxTD domain-containing protein
MNARTARLAPALGVVILLAACASTRGLKELDPKSRDFISKVRYTITAEERMAFLALAPEAREAFIEDFWKRRDPTPATPENEYKIEYYNRIARANRLFSGGGAPGWLQDRGRVYITLGPPDTRITYPRGVTFYGLPTEIWWYGLYTIAFVDPYWNDDYKLAPESAAQVAIINQAQRDWNLPKERMPKPGEQNYGTAIAGLKVDLVVAKDATARISLAIPYRNIWLKAAGKLYQANLEIHMKVLDKDGAEAWTFTQAYPIEITEAGLRDVLAGDFTAQAAVPALKTGAYSLTVLVTNTADGSKASLERRFEI